MMRLLDPAGIDLAAVRRPDATGTGGRRRGLHRADTGDRPGVWRDRRVFRDPYTGWKTGHQDRVMCPAGGAYRMLLRREPELAAWTWDRLGDRMIGRSPVVPTIAITPANRLDVARAYVAALDRAGFRGRTTDQSG